MSKQTAVDFILQGAVFVMSSTGKPVAFCFN